MTLLPILKMMGRTLGLILKVVDILDTLLLATLNYILKMVGVEQ